MMKIETDLKTIEKTGRKKDDENWEFRTFLKCLDMESDELDSIVHQITAEVSSQIDCTACGNCCKTSRPTLDEEDVSEFASGLGIPIPVLQQKHLKVDKHDASKYLFKSLPCPFLKNNRCTNYDHRPTDCHSFPHLYEVHFISRLYGVLANYSICPIVFNVYERLKVVLWS